MVRKQNFRNGKASTEVRNMATWSQVFGVTE